MGTSGRTKSPGILTCNVKHFLHRLEHFLRSWSHLHMIFLSACLNKCLTQFWLILLLSNNYKNFILFIIISFSFARKQKPNKQQPSALELLTNKVWVFLCGLLACWSWVDVANCLHLQCVCSVICQWQRCWNPTLSRCSMMSLWIWEEKKTKNFFLYLRLFIISSTMAGL